MDDGPMLLPRAKATVVVVVLVVVPYCLLPAAHDARLPS